MRVVKFAELGITDTNTLRDVTNILKSGQFIYGKYNNQFNDVFAGHIGAEYYAVGVASGSAALIASLRLLLKGAVRRKVVVPELSFAATLFSVIEANASPVYCRVDEYGLMDWDHCRELLNDPGISIIIPVHLYGQDCNVPDDILDKVHVIEDACQAHGVIKPKGIAVCYSFYPSKNIGAAGDAGAVVSADENFIRNLKRYINYGDLPGVEKYHHSIVGNNMRMDEIQAAVLVNKLKVSPAHVATQRGQQAAIYREQGVISFTRHENNAYHLYPVLVEDRYTVARLLREKGIDTGIHYPYALQELPPDNRSDLSYHARNISRHELSLPIGAHLSNADIRYVCQVLAELKENSPVKGCCEGCENCEGC